MKNAPLLLLVLAIAIAVVAVKSQSETVMLSQAKLYRNEAIPTSND